jgi:hypothetical protein
MRYNLLDKQAAALIALVTVYKETGELEFYRVATLADPGGLMFNTKPQRRASVSTSDLLLFERLGFVVLRPKADGSIAGGTICQLAVDAVDCDFRVPQPPHAQSSVTNNFYAPVGAANTGTGSIAIQSLAVGSIDEVSQLLQQMRSSLDDLEATAQPEALDLLNDLDSEIHQNVPKQSRIKAFLRSLWPLASNAAQFASNMTRIAEAFGIDLKHLQQ